MEKPGSEIPKFDLAEQIMARKRKLTSAKRRAPIENLQIALKQQASKLTNQPTSQPDLVSTRQQGIVAEIVTKDICQFLNLTVSD
ncbi:MAG: hypothetical protein JXB29_02445 [Sedimentisphaerales bacterium]|nr:hypothetical protein [Sedimentisphaerales bacterium]